VQTTGTAGGYDLIKNVHSEEGKKSFSAVIFQTALIGDLLHEDAIGGHAGILKLRKSTGLTQLLFAGRA